MEESFASEQRSRGRVQKMSGACTRTDDEPLSPNLLGNEQETKVFNSSLNKPDGPSLHQITNETHVEASAVLERLDQRNDQPVPDGFPCQQPSETGRSMRCLCASR